MTLNEVRIANASSYENICENKICLALQKKSTEVTGNYKKCISNEKLPFIYRFVEPNNIFMVHVVTSHRYLVEKKSFTLCLHHTCYCFAKTMQTNVSKHLQTH